ncbi:MAG: dihydroorotase [Alphaproteobacteria bacterium]|nr:dihydroorotase [Alphaproteobacteria bacterium]
MSLAHITITKPDDWHVHLRDGEMLKAVLPYTARRFARAMVMPNLKPPVVTTAQAKVYRDEILSALPKGMSFEPLMAAYLTDDIDPCDLERGFNDKVFAAAKLYPVHATTNSESGVTQIKSMRLVFEKMQRIGMPLLIHGEMGDPSIDIFDRESAFVDRVLVGLRRDYPALKIVLEHITTRQAADYVADEGRGGKLAATITAHHLLINRNSMLAGGMKPHNYCLPVAKREVHRQALIRAAVSGGGMFFLGTDSAPHPRTAKECACGCAGIFTACNALEIYAQVFSEAGALDQLERFTSLNGPAFYGLSANKDKITLERGQDCISSDLASVIVGQQEIIPFKSPINLFWRVVDQ